MGLAVWAGVTLVASFFIAQAFAPKAKPPIRKSGDLSQQTAEEGNPIPLVMGVYRPIGGNVMWSSPPRIEIIKEKAGKGGKGGGKTQYQKVEHAFRSYAIRICASLDDSPVYLQRMWRNNKLVYKAPDEGDQKFLKLCTYYNGSQEEPSPLIEQFEGVGEVPHHHGIAYITVSDEDLTDLGGAIPSFTFEVATAVGKVITSTPHPYEGVEGVNIDDISLSYEIRNMHQQHNQPQEDKFGNFSFDMDAELRQVKITHNQPQEDKFGNFSFDMDAELRQVKITHNQPQEDKFGNFSFDMDAELRQVKITHNQPQEDKFGNFSFDMDAELIKG